MISIHALLAESDWAAITLREVLSYFYPRSPCGERQTCLKHPTMGKRFLSTLSLRRATGSDTRIIIDGKISIHALLAESDHWLFGIAAVVDDISIHALLAESDKYYGVYTDSEYFISIHALLAESDVII